MASKSDSRRSRRISATTAGRSFSRILDQIALGRRFVVHRHGQDVCAMGPVEPPERSASECLVLLRTGVEVRLDDRFGDDLLEIIRTEEPEQRPWG